ncbi:MAG: hypothetical protein ACE37M_03875 [Henriciella sp.]
MIKRACLLSLSILSLGACQHAQTAVPAALTDAQPETMAALKSGLAAAMGRASIELGADRGQESSTVSVLPQKLSEYETRSPEKPIIFNLFVKDGICFAVQDGSESEIPLPDVSCQPL